MEISFSNTISRNTVYEDFSILRASLEDAVARTGGEDSISNEMIRKGDRLLETYTVESDAVHGGMGSVWQVRHESWHTGLAMKRPQPRFFAEGSEQRKKDFIAECEHWINLGLHPNIVSCYYIREIGGVPTIFSEWMDGGSLKDAIRDGRLYEGTEAEVRERILDIAVQAARGLACSHAAGLIHQDVKPGNILLNQNMEAKVADFGLARAQSQLGPEGRRAAGYTPQYCPREQAAGAPPEAWMDLYAWALTVLEMYAGGRTWETGAEAAERAEQILAECRVAPPAAMRAVILRLLNGKDGEAARLEGELTEIYRAETGRDYPRKAPEAVTDTADSLNNRALSMLDLGKPEAAEALWETALAASPTHVYATFNYLVYRWYRGEADDLQVIGRLTELYRTLNTRESFEALNLARACRGTDEAVKTVRCDPSAPDSWPPEMEEIRGRIPVVLNEKGFLENGNSERRFTFPENGLLLQLTPGRTRLRNAETGEILHETGPVAGAETVTFARYDEDAHTVLLGSTGYDRSCSFHERNFTYSRESFILSGSMRLFDLRNGRCVRTLQPGASEEFPEDAAIPEHVFGLAAAVRGEEPCYCYPNELLTALRYRKPDFSAPPAAWLVSRIRDYGRTRERAEALDACVRTARAKLEEGNVAEAFEAVEQGYRLLDGMKNPALSELNAACGRYGRITGIRSVETESLSPEEAASLPDARDEKPVCMNPGRLPRLAVRSRWKYHVTEYGLRRHPLLVHNRKKVLRLKKQVFAEQDAAVSPGGDYVFIRAVKQDSTSRFLFIADAATGRFLTEGTPAEGEIACLSPDGKTLVTWQDSRIFTWRVTGGGKRPGLEKNPGGFDAGFGETIWEVFFLQDGRTLCIMTERGAISLFDTRSGKPFPVREENEQLSGGRLTARDVSLYPAGVTGFLYRPKEGKARKWTVEYAYEFPGYTDWDEGARPYLETFLFYHPEWTEEDFAGLLELLSESGYGWLRPEGVREKLRETAARTGGSARKKRNSRIGKLLLQAGGEAE